ncbi:MAG: hypothetical protein OQK24_02860 [Magnetovibrio sp.]|nr:hypothetical protein [Magnetovibrio sp.]
MITYMLTSQDIEKVQEEFQALVSADNLLQADGHFVSPSRLQAYAQGQLDGDTTDIENALNANPDLRAAHRTMIRNTALFILPEAMAAASPNELPERKGRGCKLSFKPSRAEENLLYLIVELLDFTDSKPETLVVSGTDDRIYQISLPPSRNGIIQVIVEKNSDIVRLLSDPKSEAYLR